MATKLERGFETQVKRRTAFSQVELEEYRTKYFSKDGAARGDQTIENFAVIQRRMSIATHTGTIEGRTINDLVAGKGASTTNLETTTPLTLNRVFQFEGTVKLFLAFATIRHVPESILFWSEVECLQNINWKANRVLGITQTKSTNEEIQDRAKKIWKTFLSPDASYEVCLPGHLLEEIETAVLNRSSTRHTFAKAQTLVFRDMEKGLFREFLQSLNSAGLRLINNCINNAPAPGLATANAFYFTRGNTEPEIDIGNEVREELN